MRDKFLQRWTIACTERKKSEAAAQIEQVTSDLQRAQRARQTNRSAVTDSELQKWVTDLALARSKHESPLKISMTQRFERL